ncbi:hypothetical protein H8D85_02440 [bacterium]|nr:hypothetical protein [bacterium]
MLEIIPVDPAQDPERRDAQAAPIIFGPLYAKASNGKIKSWEASVSITREGHGRMTFTFGYLDGKKQVQEQIMTSGKNIGRANETTPYEQACKEVESKMNKKSDAGYTQTTIGTPLLPMLAHSYDKRSHNISWPAYVQPKIDGVRCLVKRDSDGSISLMTRKGKEMTPMNHIIERLEKLYDLAGDLKDDLYFDGELYSDTLSFQELAGALRRHENTEETLQQIYLIVFDMFQDNTPHEFGYRKSILDSIFSSFEETAVKLIHTRAIEEFELETKLQEFLEEGYEGIIIRNEGGLYKKGFRSADLQKWKRFQDDEFIIVGYKQGTGVEEGCVIWECESNELEVPNFWVRPRGDHASRKALYTHADDSLGKLLTVRFQELTTDGIPRFPVGIAMRDYE